jgi:hypothetical protein
MSERPFAQPMRRHTRSRRHGYLPLMGIKTSGEFRAYFLERFAGVMNLTMKNADKTRSAIPGWAKHPQASKLGHSIGRIETAWNIQIPEAIAASGTPGP